MVIRDYDRNDAFAITRLFYETVHSVNSKDYSEEQVRAWAPEIPDPDIWHSRMIQRCTLVAEESGQVIAFAELECDGHLDMFYCRRDVIGHGVGRQLYQTVETRALDLGLRRIFTEASITARPFFHRCGFFVIQHRTVIRRGIQMTNFKMEKQQLP
jgi:putative acetyltransferase